jgi:hypothetical protein
MRVLVLRIDTAEHWNGGGIEKGEKGTAYIQEKKMIIYYKRGNGLLQQVR